jgi:hypothetical protein
MELRREDYAHSAAQVPRLRGKQVPVAYVGRAGHPHWASGFWTRPAAPASRRCSVPGGMVNQAVVGGNQPPTLVS